MRGSYLRYCARREMAVVKMVFVRFLEAKQQISRGYCTSLHVSYLAVPVDLTGSFKF